MFRQLIQRRPEPVAEREALGFGVGQRVAPRHIVPQHPRLSNRAPAAAVDRRVGRDPQQPRAERAGGVVAVQLHQRRQQPILRCVLGVVHISQNRAGDAAHRPRIRLHQRTERRPIPRERARDERGLVHPCLARWVRVGQRAHAGVYGGSSGDADNPKTGRSQPEDGLSAPSAVAVVFQLGSSRPLHSELNEGSGCVRATVTSAAAIILAACMGAPGGGGSEAGRGGRFGSPGGLEPTQPRYINPGTLAALPGFTHAVRAGSTLYVSGEVALDSTGQIVGPGDLRAQARQAFANPPLLPKSGGAAPADVAKLTIYVVNYSPRDFAAIREAGAEFLPARNPPAGIVVGVQSLPMEGLLIAVDATAVVRAMFQPGVR